jgi:hypothetical protein
VSLTQPFLLGSLTHYNFPVTAGTNAASVELHLDVDVSEAVGGADLFNETIGVALAIDETPNATPCVYPSTTPCADRIALATSAERTFSTTVNGFIYDLEVLGFRSTPDGAGVPLDGFISNEGGSTTGYLVATFAIRCVDADADGACDLEDNCAGVVNPDQADADADGAGDACDVCPLDAANDADADGVCGDVDNCPLAANPDQSDLDGDGQGDVCDACTDEDFDTVCRQDDVCPATVLPEAPSVSLGVWRWMDTNGDGVFDTTPSGGQGPKRSYTMADTAGCSCTQIIAALNLGSGHSKFGCSISAMDEWGAGLD